MKSYIVIFFIVGVFLFPVSFSVFQLTDNINELQVAEAKGGRLFKIHNYDENYTYRLEHKILSRHRDFLFGVFPLKGIEKVILSKLEKPKTTTFSFLFGNSINWSYQLISVNRPSFDEVRDLRFPTSVWKRVSDPNEEILSNEQKIMNEIYLKSEGEFVLDCWRFPIKSLKVSEFSSPRSLPDGRRYYHTGADYRARTGDPIFAALSGEVVFAGHMIVPGNMVVLYHGGGVNSRYMHLNSIEAKYGEKVSQKNLIGLAGGTGRVTAPHLHWEIVWKGNHADPEHFLRSLGPACDQG